MSTTTTLYCALVPVAGTVGGAAMLVPNTAVAETLSQERMTAISSAPGGVVGVVTVGEARVPVISVEALQGAPSRVPARARIVVFHALGEGPANVPSFALLANGYPHLVAVTERLLAELPLQEQDRDVAACARVRVGNTEALIPDVDRLEAVARAFQPQPDGP